MFACNYAICGRRSSLEEDGTEVGACNNKTWKIEAIAEIWMGDVTHFSGLW